MPGGAGNVVRTSTLWPRALDGGPDDEDAEPDPALAREKLTSCGHPDGFSTVFAVPDVPTIVEMAGVVAEQLAEVGIRVEVRPLDPATYYATDVATGTRSPPGATAWCWPPGPRTSPRRRPSSCRWSTGGRCGRWATRTTRASTTRR
ncbi:hypothetical protein A7K94_0216320 [Modestobacter sp. VKM Ac-2676]|nr:hypothetical protein A7K94_0216320 [Modestobacter sp. VKM Ac-2676]